MRKSTGSAWEAPKYGNDNDRADAMASRVFNDLADMTARAGKEAGLDHYNIVSVNNSMSAEWGEFLRGLRLRPRARRPYGQWERPLGGRG